MSGERPPSQPCVVFLVEGDEYELSDYEAMTLAADLNMAARGQLGPYVPPAASELADAIADRLLAEDLPPIVLEGDRREAVLWALRVGSAAVDWRAEQLARALTRAIGPI